MRLYAALDYRPRRDFSGTSQGYPPTLKSRGSSPSSGVDRVMSTLKFNFNKPKPVIKQAPTSSKPAFDDSDDENSLLNPNNPKKLSMAISGLNEDLRSYTSLSEDTSARMAKEALQVDPSGPIPIVY
jgi:hypothetical protein